MLIALSRSQSKSLLQNKYEHHPKPQERYSNSPPQYFPLICLESLKKRQNDCFPDSEQKWQRSVPIVISSLATETVTASRCTTTPFKSSITTPSRPYRLWLFPFLPSSTLLSFSFTSLSLPQALVSGFSLSSGLPVFLKNCQRRHCLNLSNRSGAFKIVSQLVLESANTGKRIYCDNLSAALQYIHPSFPLQFRHVIRLEKQELPTLVRKSKPFQTRPQRLPSSLAEDRLVLYLPSHRLHPSQHLPPRYLQAALLVLRKNFMRSPPKNGSSSVTMLVRPSSKNFNGFNCVCSSTPVGTKIFALARLNAWNFLVEDILSPKASCEGRRHKTCFDSPGEYLRSGTSQLVEVVDQTVEYLHSENFNADAKSKSEILCKRLVAKTFGSATRILDPFSVSKVFLAVAPWYFSTLVSCRPGYSHKYYIAKVPINLKSSRSFGSNDPWASLPSDVSSFLLSSHLAITLYHLT